MLTKNKSMEEEKEFLNQRIEALEQENRKLTNSLKDVTDKIKDFYYDLREEELSKRTA